MEDEEEFFDSLDEKFKEMLDAQSMDGLQAIENQWLRIGEIISRLEDGTRFDWLEDQLYSHGVNIKSLLMFGLKLAMAKNVPPMDYTAALTSGYLLGYLTAKDDSGENIIDEILSQIPERDEDEDEDESEEFPSKAIVQLAEMGPTPSMHSLEEVGKFLRYQSREIGKSFVDPEDDWAPVMLVVTSKMSSMVGMEIPEDNNMKDMLFRRVLPKTIRQMLGKPKVVGFLVSAWTAEGPEASKVRPSENPDRTETLFLYLRDKEGKTEMWTAPILRDGEQAPALGKWERDDSDEQEGRIVTMFDRIFQ